MDASTIPDGYEIGPARLEELAALPGIEDAASAVFPREDLSTSGPAGLSPEDFASAQRDGRLWVARTRDPAAPVGFATALRLDGVAYLREIDVLPEHGRRGLGAALVATVADWGRAWGSPSLTLVTFRHLPWNGPFYARLGFAEIPESARGPELRALLEQETARGLDPRKRVAMRLRLAGD